jgi:hypothetical protein
MKLGFKRKGLEGGGIGEGEIELRWGIYHLNGFVLT